MKFPRSERSLEAATSDEVWRRMNSSPISLEYLPDRAAALDRLEISTREIAPADRFEFWRDQFAALHHVDVEGSRRCGFEASGRYWVLGSVLFGIYQTPARTVTRRKKQIARDDLDHWFIRVVRNGQIHSRSQNGSFTVEPGQITIGTYAQAYEEEHTADEWILAVVPRNAIPHLENQVSESRILRGSPSSLLADFLISLAQRLPRVTHAELSQLGEALHGMISVCITDSEHSGVARSPIGVVREVVERIIARHISSSRLTPTRIAELAGISRSTLYRAFELDGGVAQHISRLRLELVRRDLESSFLDDVPIYRLAERRGLHNVASFNRSFRCHFGLTPSDVRAARQNASRMSSRTEMPTSFVDFLRTIESVS